MFWFIEYINGNTISEQSINFNYVDKERVKRFYFKNKNGDVYGINMEKLTFFINNQEIDIKIKGESPKLLQYKTASMSITSNVHKISSWNLGVETYLNNEIHKYVMNIKVDGEIYIVATKQNLISGKVEEKRVPLH
ncbi:hypothetical protein D3C81_893730 [compost metagenome]